MAGQPELELLGVTRGRAFEAKLPENAER